MTEIVRTYEDNLLDIHLNHPYLYVPTMSNNLVVFDISNPNNPIQVFNYSLPGLITSLSFQKNAFATFYSTFPTLGLVTLDISNPPQVIPLDTLNFSERKKRMIAAKGNLIYVTNDFPAASEVQIVDASQPANLQTAGRISVYSIIGYSPSLIEMQAGDSVVVLGTTDGVKIFDCRRPNLPFEYAKYHSGLAVPVLAWSEPFIYVSMEGDSIFGGGLIALKYDTTSGSTDPEVPENYKLFQNYPNPFNHTTIIKFDLPADGPVSLKIFNVLGEEVTTLISEPRPSGFHSVKWNAAGLASGIYIYRLTTDGFTESRKMVLMK
jgi:hypothetical protein